MSSKSIFTNLHGFSTLNHSTRRAAARNVPYQNCQEPICDSRDQYQCDEDKDHRTTNQIGNILWELLDILFPGHARETFRSVEGIDTSPITATRMGSLYHLTEDSRRHFAAARNDGRSLIQDEAADFIRK